MCKRLRLSWGTGSVEVSLNESSTAQALYASAPFEAAANRWGDEVFLATEVAGEAAEADAETVSLGDAAFWPPGQALCLFFGPTPLSVGDEIRPASPVAVIGRIEGGADAWDRLAEVRDGLELEVRAAAAGAEQGE